MLKQSALRIIFVKEQTSGEAGKDLNLEVHLPALPAAAMTACETKQMIILLTTYKTRVAAGPRPFTLSTIMLTHVIYFLSFLSMDAEVGKTIHSQC